MKVCSKCRETKELLEFPKRTDSKDGHESYCKICRMAASAKYRANNKEKVLASVAAARKKEHWSTKLLRGSKSSASSRGLEHSITTEDILDLWKSQEGKCYWFKVQLSERKDLPDRHPLKPSIDRLDNSKGYINGNVVLSSTFANLGRSNTTVEDFSEFLKLLQELYNDSSK